MVLGSFCSGSCLGLCDGADYFPHEGEEFGYVIKGEIVLSLGKRRIKVKKGESFYYVADKVHSILNKGNKDAEFIWVSSPPSF